MSGLFDALSKATRFQTILLSWFVPILLSVLAFTVVLGPQLHGTWLVHQFHLITARLAINATIAVVIVSAVLAIVASMARDSLYRLLEGYSWPRAIREWRVRTSHRPNATYINGLKTYLAARMAHDRLQDDLRRATERGGENLLALEATVDDAEEVAKEWQQVVENRRMARRLRGRKRGLMTAIPRRQRPLFVARDRGERSRTDELPPYPQDLTYVAATRFGNRMSSMESYGFETYGLDSQNLWYELIDVSSDPMRAALESAQERVDFFVALWYGCTAFTIAAIAVAIWLQSSANRDVSGTVIAAVGSLLLLKTVHAQILRAAEGWSYVMRAFVNQARVALAEKNNLELPEHSVTERDLWQAFTTTVLSPGRAAKARATLDLHRKAVQLPTVGKSVVARAEGAIGGENVILNIRACVDGERGAGPSDPIGS